MAKKSTVRNQKKYPVAAPNAPREVAVGSPAPSFNRTSALVSLRLGFFLARRQIGRGHLWTTLLITLVMTLTFLNLVFIGGILVGLIEGAAGANRTHYSSDLLISEVQGILFFSHLI